jgi:1,4-alpha-glucan branching enzyme
VMEYLDDITGGYSTYAYYAPTSRFGSVADFQKLVDELHQAGIGVILDWTPAQFPRYASGLEKFDGTPLYERQNPAEAIHPFWGTLLYNYGSPMVKDFLISNACFWAEVYHADGLRMDDVDAMLYLDYGRNQGEWTPNIYGTNENLDALEFLKHLNSVIKERNPGLLLVAQENGLWPELTDSVGNDHLGFDYKWSGGWTKDLLEYLSKDPIERKNYHDQLTMSMLYAYCEHYILTLGSRDVGTLKDFADKLPGSEEQKNAQIREAYAYMMLHPGCKMMAPDKDMPKELELCVKDLNNMYLAHPALYQLDDEYDGFEWVQLMKYEENVIAFMRKTEKPEETILAVCNFAAIPYENYNVGVPFAGKYKEIFNSDASEYGGTGFGLAASGVISIIRNLQYLRNPELKEKRRIYETDERNRMLGLRCWAYTGYTMMLMLYIGVLVSGFISMTVAKTLIFVAALFAVLLLVFRGLLQKVM